MSNDNDNVPKPNPQVSTIAAHAAPVAFGLAVKGFLAKELKKDKAYQADLVDVVVPRDFPLTLDDHTRVHVPAGFQSMPRTWADHWFARANGVSPASDKPAKTKKLTAAQQRALDLEGQMEEVRGGKVTDVIDQLPALSVEELQALLELEQAQDKPRATVVTAVKAEQAKRG